MYCDFRYAQVQLLNLPFRKYMKDSLLVSSPFLKTLAGENIFPRPIWFLRQAGRYLPIYRKFAELIPDFWERCFSPDISSEISTFPIQEFPLDAVIFFSDILTIPHSLGQKIQFSKESGILIDPCDPLKLLENYNVNMFHKDMFPVYQGITMTRLKMGEEMPLIGFCGAAWTLATYIIGSNHADRMAATLHFAKKDPAAFEDFLMQLSDIIAQHLCNQISAGCDAVQIFDSWSGAVPEAHQEDWLWRPWQRIMSQVAAYSPQTPIILFPRSYKGSPQDFASLEHMRALHLSEDMNIQKYVQDLPAEFVIQGGLDPQILLQDAATIEASVKELIAMTQSRPFVLNIGHGVPPATPLDSVRKVIEVARASC